MIMQRHVRLAECVQVPSWHAGGLQDDAVASLAERPSDVGEQLAALAAEHSQLSARLAEAEAAERKLDALAQLQQRLADFDLLMSTGKALDCAPCPDLRRLVPRPWMQQLSSAVLHACSVPCCAV